VRRDYLFSRANLVASNSALKEAREIWKKVHANATPGSGEEKAEAQAREQYFLFKTQTQTLLNEYFRAKAAVEHGQGNARKYPKPQAQSGPRETETERAKGFPFYIGTGELSPAQAVAYKNQSREQRLAAMRGEEARLQAERKNAGRQHEAQRKRLEAEFEERTTRLKTEMEKIKAEAAADSEKETRY
jgi:hypothetical protein